MSDFVLTGPCRICGVETCRIGVDCATCQGKMLKVRVGDPIERPPFQLELEDEPTHPDSARLDWWNDNPQAVTWRNGAQRWGAWIEITRSWTFYNTLREAIDAAREGGDE